MNGTTYIPAREADFATWVDNFTDLINTNYVAYGLTASDATALNTMNTQYQTAYSAAIAGTTRGPASVNAKDVARANVTGRARQLAIILQANPGITDLQKTQLGITVRKTNKTPVPPPTSSPLLGFVAATPLQHTIRYADQNTPASRALPFGAVALQLRVFVGATPPTPTTPATYVLTQTKNPVPVNFDVTDVGKTAYYLGLWINRKGDLGPASTQISQIII